ncbi:MAG: hypothetical protein ACUZ8H_14070 [Candidatus Anammoxibacter sp.]
MNCDYKCYIFTCGLSFKEKPVQTDGYHPWIVFVKTVKDCERLLTENMFDCKGTQFLRCFKEKIYIRQWPTYRRYEIVIVSKSVPKMTQKEVRHIIQGYWNYDRIIEKRQGRGKGNVSSIRSKM